MVYFSINLHHDMVYLFGKGEKYGRATIMMGNMLESKGWKKECSLWKTIPMGCTNLAIWS